MEVLYFRNLAGGKAIAVASHNPENNFVKESERVLRSTGHEGIFILLLPQLVYLHTHTHTHTCIQLRHN
jgi:hypothetical protein